MRHGSQESQKLTICTKTHAEKSSVVHIFRIFSFSPADLSSSRFLNVSPSNEDATISWNMSLSSQSISCSSLPTYNISALLLYSTPFSAFRFSCQVILIVNFIVCWVSVLWRTSRRSLTTLTSTSRPLFDLRSPLFCVSNGEPLYEHTAYSSLFYDPYNC